MRLSSSLQEVSDLTQRGCLIIFGEAKRQKLEVDWKQT